jgi:hypothetical protein
MGRYRIVKFSSDRPDKRTQAIRDSFDNLELATQVKEELERTLPHRQFAIEPVAVKSQKRRQREE